MQNHPFHESSRANAVSHVIHRQVLDYRLWVLRFGLVELVFEEIKTLLCFGRITGGGGIGFGCVLLRISGYCDEKSGARITTMFLLMIWEWKGDF